MSTKQQSVFHKLKYLVPNSCTSMSLLLGLASVVQSVQGNYSLAAWMILWGVLLDKLDGTFARLLHASSEFGAQMDSFADFVSFGIAPAGLLYFALHDPAMSDVVNGTWLTAACGVYVVAVAARLARFNIAEPPLGHLMFYGIPTTFMGATIASGYLTWKELSYSVDVLSIVPFFLFIASVAMVSSVKLPKVKPRKNLWLNIFQALNILFAYCAAPFQMFPNILFIQGLLYLVCGVVWYAFYPPQEDTETELSEATV